MPPTDLVPCFYTGQRRAVERPAKVLPRAEVHELKKYKLGKFVDNGKVFLFFKAIKEAVRAAGFLDGPLGIGNLLPFAKAHNYGDKLHYDVGPKGLKRHGLYHRRDQDGKMQVRSHLIHVSSRVLFSQPGMQWANYVRTA